MTAWALGEDGHVVYMPILGRWEGGGGTLHSFSLARVDFAFAWKHLSCVFGFPLCGQHKGFLGWEVVTGSVQLA